MFFFRFSRRPVTTGALIVTALVGLAAAISVQAAPPSKDRAVTLTGPLVYHYDHYCSVVNVSGHELTNVAVKFFEEDGDLSDGFTHSSIAAGLATRIYDEAGYAYCTVSFFGQPGDVRVAHCGLDDDQGYNNEAGVIIGHSCVPVN